MKNLKSRLLPLVNAIFTLVFVVHASIIGYNIKYPEHVSITTYTKDLKDMEEFPVSFKICVKELVNSQDRYRKFGSKNVWSFYRGISTESLDEMYINKLL